MSSPHFILITVIWGQILRYKFEIWRANYSHVGPVHIIRFLEIFDFRALFPEKLVFWNFEGQNPKILKIWDSNIVENSISFVMTPFVCDLLQCTLICDRYSWQPFLAQNHMTWRHWNVIFSKFVQLNLTKFSDKVSNWCQIRYWKFGGDIFRSCQVIVNIREGAEYAPSAGRPARVNSHAPTTIFGKFHPWPLGPGPTPWQLERKRYHTQNLRNSHLTATKRE